MKSGTGIDAGLSEKIAQFSLLCAALVVAIHVPGQKASSWLSLYISEGIARIAVPYFFVVSGFFLGLRTRNGHWYGRELVKRIRSIIIPYCVWCLIYGILVNLTIIGANISYGRVWSVNAIDFTRIFGLDCSSYPLLFPLWYLRSLFVLVLISPIVVWIVRKSTLSALIFIIGLLTLVVARPIFNCWWYDFVAGAWGESGILYFTVGIILSERSFSLSQKCARVILLLGLALFAIKVSLWGANQDGETVKCAIMFHCAIICTLWGLWVLFKPQKGCQNFVRLSFPLYLVHQIAFFLLGLFVPRILDGFIAYVVWYTMGVCFSVLSIRLLDLLPKSALRIIWGGRNV